MATGGRRRGALEQDVLGCLAAAGRPLTVDGGPCRSGDDLAYTTVMTALSRLHAKGALTREPAGRAFAYSLPADPVAMGASVTAKRMSRLLDSGQDRAGVLTRFVADLSPADEQLLTELLTDGRKRQGEARRDPRDAPAPARRRLLGLSASWIGRRLPPETAVRLLTAAMFVTALSTGFVLVSPAPGVRSDPADRRGRGPG